MRTIDEVKKERIDAAVYRIAADEGIAAVSFGKIAKMAGVSPATPYVYYQDKADMLTRLFLDALAKVEEGVGEAIAGAEGIEGKILACLFHYAGKFHEHPLEAAYLRAVNGNYRLLSPECPRPPGSFAAPVEKLFAQATGSGRLAVADRERVASLLFGPLFYMMGQRENGGAVWEPGEMRELARLAVRAVLA